MRSPQLCLLKLNGIPILEQLRIEEALLRADARNWCIWNTESTPAIVLGISGKVEQMIDLKLWHQKPVPLIRRFSGGGTVLINHDTCFATFIGNSADFATPAQTHAVHEWAAAIYAELFLPEQEFRLCENDYVLGHRKCGGNAQYLCKQRWLHHTSFLWNFCAEMMQLLSMPPKMPEYRARRKHTEFLCTLDQHFDSKIDFQNRLFQAMSSRFTIVEVALEDVLPVLEKPHRKATQLVMTGALEGTLGTRDSDDSDHRDFSDIKGR